MKNSILKFVATVLLIHVLFNEQAKAQTQIFHQGFDSLNVSLLNGWKAINKSNPLGLGTWMQGHSFTTAAIGVNTSYVQVDFTSTDSIGTISNWLLSDTMTLQNNDTVTFYTLSYNGYQYRDNMECRLSMMDTSSNVGVNDTSKGDFSTLIVAVNPNYDSISYPSVLGAGSIHTWKLFKGAITGLSGPTKCRIGFRYYVPNGGYAGLFSSTIGLDELTVTRYLPAGIDENNLSIKMNLSPNPANESINLNIDTKGNYLVKVFNLIGGEVLSFRMESSKTIDISTYPSSVYTLKVLDANNGACLTKLFIKQ